MSEKTLKSHCFCGAVEVEITGEPAAQVYCHCSSCRGWLGAPIHAATLWPTPKVNVRKGADKLAVIKKTEASHRTFCTACGAPVLVRHPAIGMTDVPAGTIAAFAFKPTLHVHYGEKVLQVRDGLPKFKDFPKEFGGSGATVPE
ncbi:MAG: GFA family protein [Myxococcota bacterium]